MNRKLFIRVMLAAASIMCCATGAAQTPSQSPNDVIVEAMGLIEKELDGRKQELTENKDELFRLVDKILLPRFDKKAAGRFVLGKAARTAKPEQIDAFIQAFYENLLRRYADGILEFDSNRIEVLPFSGDETKNRATVRTKVALDDGTIAPVDYRLVKRGKGWLIYDVVIEGISYLTTFRSELDSELRQKSLDEVIARLNKDNGIEPAK